MNPHPHLVVLIEPGELVKRDRFAQRLFTAGKSYEEEGKAKERLKAIRQTAVVNSVPLLSRFRKSLSLRKECKTFYAKDSRTAAQYIARAVRPLNEVVINASNAVFGIEEDLKASGLALIDSYERQFAEGEEVEAPKRFWDLPSPPFGVLWESMESTPFFNEGAEQRPPPLRDMAALCGVNAAAAEDGSFYFFQHSRNIGLLLREAKKLIFLVETGKIVEKKEDALFQAMCVGAFGISSQILKLGTKKTKEPPPELPALSEPADFAIPEIHVVILESGPTEIQKGKYQELLNCIGCRACLRRCPTTPFFPPEGKSYPRNYLWNFLLKRGKSIELCTQCGSCKLECPLEIDTPRLILEARHDHPLGLWEGRANRVLYNFPRLMEMASPVAGLVNLMMKGQAIKALTEKAVGLSRNRRLPDLQSETFARWFGHYPTPSAGKKIVYYPGCFVNFVEPETGKAVVRVLEMSGHQVIVPKHLCCGMSRIGTGELKGARQMGQRLIDALYPYAKQGREILFSCPSCGLSLRQEYGWLLDDPRVEVVSEKTKNLFTYLLGLSRKGQFNLKFKEAEGSVAYHTPCHLKAQGNEGDAAELLKLIPGLRVSNVDRGCCGMSGTFGLKAKFYEKSITIAAPLVQRIDELNPKEVSTDCAACAMQIGEGTNRQVAHPICIFSRYVA